MNLLTEIRRYAEKKPEISDYDKLKKAFFNAIAEEMETGRLTVAGLLNRLVELNDDERNQLFYLARLGRGSRHSRAAKLFVKLLDELNLPLRDADIKQIVTSGLNDEGRKELESIPYYQYRSI